MNLMPLEISSFLEKIGFTIVSSNEEGHIWRYEDGELLFVNIKSRSGKSALVIDSSWKTRLSEFKDIHGVVPGSQMYRFPKLLNGGDQPIQYGLSVTLAHENSLVRLLQILYPSHNTKWFSPMLTLSTSRKMPPQDTYFIGHYELLAWFEQHTGQVLTWAQLQRAPDIVAISAKGIYKPKKLKYALSISQRLDSPYSDQKPIYQENGSWQYSYAQEETPTGNSIDLFTNTGLKRCMEDGIPVAVLVQISKKPNVTAYRVLGLAKVISWKNGFFSLESTTLPEDSFIENQTVDESSTYSPKGIEDHRERIFKEIAKRQGQAAFRSGLLTAYEGRCAITGCAVKHVLEAAHITPFLGPKTNHISNGLLLRSDLHTLWDRGMIYLCDDLKLHLKSSMEDSEYFDLAGKKIRTRLNDAPGISMDAIRAHRDWCCNTN